MLVKITHVKGHTFWTESTELITALRFPKQCEPTASELQGFKLTAYDTTVCNQKIQANFTGMSSKSNESSVDSILPVKYLPTPLRHQQKGPLQSVARLHNTQLLNTNACKTIWLLIHHNILHCLPAPSMWPHTHTHNKFTGDYIAEVCDGNLKPLIVCYVVRHTVGVSYLPSSSDTSKTSVIVSGTFSLCFSVTVCEQNINNKYQQNIVSKPTHHVIMCKIIDSMR